MAPRQAVLIFAVSSFLLLGFLAAIASPGMPMTGFFIGGNSIEELQGNFLIIFGVLILLSGFCFFARFYFQRHDT